MDIRKESIFDNNSAASRRMGTAALLKGAVSILSALVLFAGCGNPVRQEQKSRPATEAAPTGFATGTVKVPSTLSLVRVLAGGGRAGAPAGRTAALSSENPLPGAAITLWRIDTNGVFSQVAGVSAAAGTASGMEGAFTISGIPMNEANLILQASFTPPSTGVPVVLRASLPALTTATSTAGGMKVNTESTFAVEGLRQAVVIVNEFDAARPKKTNDIPRPLVEAFNAAINNYLVYELNIQDTTVSIANVLTSQQSLEQEFLDLKASGAYVPAYFDRLKPARGSVDIPGGQYALAFSVQLSADEADARIFFTTDGTTPTTDSQSYTDPILISATTTLRFFAYDIDGNSDTIHTVQYYIQP